MSSVQYSTLPQDPPRYPFKTYYTMSKASYMKHEKVVKKLEGEELFAFLKNKHIDRVWKLSFFQMANGELAVACRGSDNLQNYPADVAHGLTEPTGLLKKMENTISEVENELGRSVSILTGHSEGGFFADRLLLNLDFVERVTFNAHGALRGPHNYNFRLKDCRISKGIISDRKNYLTLTESTGHSLKSFKPYRDRTWAEIAPKKYAN